VTHRPLMNADGSSKLVQPRTISVMEAMCRHALDSRLLTRPAQLLLEADLRAWLLSIDQGRRTPQSPFADYRSSLQARGERAEDKLPKELSAGWSSLRGRWTAMMSGRMRGTHWNPVLTHWF